VNRGTRSVLLLVALVTSACSVLEPKPDTSRYFLLRPSSAAPSGQPLPALVLGLGPVSLPDYLDRNEMLDLVGPYELKYSAQNRWVEPLGTQVRRTLADNLRSELRPDAVVQHPWFATEGVVLQAEVTFDAIRLDDRGAWMGSGEWVLRNAVDGTPLERNELSFEVGRDAVPPDQVAEAVSAELERLAGEIAAAVRRHY
jgi:uncharacterized lipoprotein YmbA